MFRKKELQDKNKGHKKTFKAVFTNLKHNLELFNDSVRELTEALDQQDFNTARDLLMGESLN